VARGSKSIKKGDVWDEASPNPGKIAMREKIRSPGNSKKIEAGKVRERRKH